VILINYDLKYYLVAHLLNQMVEVKWAIFLSYVVDILMIVLYCSFFVFCDALVQIDVS